MKCLLVICLLSLVALLMGAPEGLFPKHDRGCIWIEGICREECPVGTHDYTSGCNEIVPEATCDEPNPVKGKDIICDYTACHCDPPTVRNTVTKQCVPLDQCPKKE